MVNLKECGEVDCEGVGQCPCRTKAYWERWKINQMHSKEELLELCKEMYCQLERARKFISSREKMHPSGIELHNELTERAGNIVTKEWNGQSTI